MSNAHLEALKPNLLAIPVADVDEPGLPVAIFLQEAADLQTLVSDASVRSQLLSVGLPAALLDSLANDIDAARAAQSEWAVIRDRSKSEAQRGLENKGYELRRNVLTGCRWNLRHDRVAMGTLSAIAEGEGVADLIQDLSDLATLIEQRVSAFTNDQTFDAPAAVQQLRGLFGDLQTGVSQERLTTEQAEAKGLRDRAYTYLYGRIADIRRAGRYATNPMRRWRGSSRVPIDVATVAVVRRPRFQRYPFFRRPAAAGRAAS